MPTSPRPHEALEVCCDCNHRPQNLDCSCCPTLFWLCLLGAPSVCPPRGNGRTVACRGSAPRGRGLRRVPPRLCTLLARLTGLCRPRRRCPYPRSCGDPDEPAFNRRWPPKLVPAAATQLTNGYPGPPDAPRRCGGSATRGFFCRSSARAWC